MERFFRRGAALLVASLVLTAADAAGAQEVVTVIDAGGVGSDLVIPAQSNLFQLRAFGDEGAGGVRSNGSNSWCMQNVGGFTMRLQFGCFTWLLRTVNGGYDAAIFEMGMKWAAPASDLPHAIDAATSGLGGGGFTVNGTTLLIGGTVQGGGDKLWSSDRSPVDLLNLAAKSTEDATCLNHSAIRDGYMDTGFQLTPASDCEATHPAAGWRGSRPIPAEAYLELQASTAEFGPTFDPTNPNDHDPFAFWRVPEEMRSTDKFLGDWQTYGELSDWYRNGLERYGTVIPGGAGAPTYAGWPLGLTQFYDIAYFGLPTVGNVVYFQSVIVNESEKVYGVGMTYDSVYIGINVDPLLQGQGDAHYYDPRRSAMVWKESGSGCEDALNPPGSGCGGFDWSDGAAGAGIVFLKTPIGDARYKLLSDPTSDFFSPGHPRAGDTIMFQHQRQCGFGGCIPRTWSRSQRAHFGHFASIGEYTLDGETPGDMDDATYHRIFRPEAWPERTGVYNKYVPGEGEAGAPTWDWNHDGQPDTIYADACGSRGCVALWADTLPSGYTNSYGNVSDLAVGPVRMAPGDTVPFVVALVGAPDSASMESALDNAISFYQQLYLGPETAPPPAVSAVDVVAGQAATTGDVEGNRISLFFDDTPEEWVDPYLASLDVTADIARNHWLADSVAERARNNVAALHVFKSCDGGSTFTRDTDCDGDPVFDETSKWSDFGWQPYVSFEADDDGALPNRLDDFALIPGVTYTYSIVTETRGATFHVIRGADADSLVVEEVEFAPRLIGAVSASATNPNVAVVYAPLNLAAGARPAALTEVSRSGGSTVPVDFSVIGTSPVSGQYRVVFGDKLVVNQVENLDAAGAPVSTQTTVEVQTIRTVGGAAGPEEVVIESVDFSRTGTVTMSGLERQPPDSATEGSLQQTAVFEGGFGMVVAAGSTPLLASTTLAGDEATPGSFYSRDDFPFFVVSVDAGDGGTLDDRFFTDESADTIPDRVAPSVSWQTAPSRYVGGDEYGEYAIAWSADSWGADAPFRIDDPALEATVAASLAGRSSAATSSTDDDVLAAVREVDPDITELMPYSLPFSVRNNTYGRDVRVAVGQHQESVLVGQAADSVRVDVPSGVWVPGDRLYFVETVTREVADGEGNAVLDENGRPTTETVTAATFAVMLGCSAPRPSCDPTIGGELQSGYIAVDGQATLTVNWLVPLRSGDEVVVDVQRAITAAEAATSGPVSLDDVHVVPNPYLYGSAFERATDARVLKFTNLPQEGVIRIFDVAGRFIQEIAYGPEDLQGVGAFCGAADCGGDLDWKHADPRADQPRRGALHLRSRIRRPEEDGQVRRHSLSPTPGRPIHEPRTPAAARARGRGGHAPSPGNADLDPGTGRDPRRHPGRDLSRARRRRARPSPGGRIRSRGGRRHLAVLEQRGDVAPRRLHGGRDDSSAVHRARHSAHLRGRGDAVRVHPGGHQRQHPRFRGNALAERGVAERGLRGRAGPHRGGVQLDRDRHRASRGAAHYRPSHHRGRGQGDRGGNHQRHGEVRRRRHEHRVPHRALRRHAGGVAHQHRHLGPLRGSAPEHPREHVVVGGPGPERLHPGDGGVGGDRRSRTAHLVPLQPDGGPDRRGGRHPVSGRGSVAAHHGRRQRPRGRAPGDRDRARVRLQGTGLRARRQALRQRGPDRPRPLARGGRGRRSAAAGRGAGHPGRGLRLHVDGAAGEHPGVQLPASVLMRRRAGAGERSMRALLALAGLLATAAPAAAHAQSEPGSWSVAVSAGTQMHAASSSLGTSPMLALEALLQVTPRIAVGPAIQFHRADTDGSFYVAAVDFGPDSTRVYQVGQTLSALHYGASAHFSFMPGGRLDPYAVVGAGGATLYLDAQANDGIRRVTHRMVQGGGGVRYAVTEAAGVRVDVRDVVYMNFDRDVLNPVEERLRNCGTDGVCRFPDAERAHLPDKQDMVHNVRLSIGLTYVPGLNR